MNKSIVLLVVVLSLIVGAAFGELERESPCGKFSTQRMLTHKLRHCEKPARDLYGPVSRQCCNDLHSVSIQCIYAIFSSDAFKNVGVNPHIGITIPARCHHTYGN
ncbi:hypothetical protein PIB30_039971 [Stylosanthes scabra]|uniref:Bifunctional inhibitor/plant lipid transfer protein/seed storage helical domain-containing protein n=1 Tax=Stylosanthes scabra TaxID=79078 RepID=A0ABU6VCN3_9FABA|nr:hypothetical protein [Stylosanthes scabra]